MPAMPDSKIKEHAEAWKTLETPDSITDYLASLSAFDQRDAVNTFVGLTSRFRRARYSASPIVNSIIDQINNRVTNYHEQAYPLSKKQCAVLAKWIA